MPYLPTMPTQQTVRDVTDVFYGYNHQAQIGGGEFYEMENLSSDNFPLMSPRKPRGLVLWNVNVQGMTELAGKLAYVQDGTLWYADKATPVSGLGEGRKQMVCMGAYICIFPDKVYYNTADESDYGSMEAEYSSTGTIKYKLCKADGTVYEKKPTVSDTAPAEPQNGDLWLDSSGESYSLKIYSSSLVQWATVPTVYTRIEFISSGEIPKLFKEHDGVSISGSSIADVNGEKIIYALGVGEGADYIVVANILKEAAEQTTGFISIKRSVPEMDYICESQNRLWGCYFGKSGDVTLNEIYCCALGDFKNWRQYMGLSTDSWTASVGADGEWTGAVNYMGYPMFFKETAILRVGVSNTGAHSINETAARGVQSGCAESLCVVNETLYYKARGAVCAYQGGFPSSVSEPLGAEEYHDAAAGALADKYYIEMTNAGGDRYLFVYDLKRGLWMKETALRAWRFTEAKGELYALTETGMECLIGSKGRKEPYVSWSAESGMLYYQYPDKKYVSRYNLRIEMQPGAEMKIYIQYDSGKWELKGFVEYKGTGTVTLPIWARRCDHMRLRFVGKGDFKIYSIAKILEIGSDM